MSKYTLKKLKEDKKKLAIIDENVAERIKNLSSITGVKTEALIDVATDILEQAIGRQIILRSEDENLELKINHFKRYNKIVNLSDKFDKNEQR